MAPTSWFHVVLTVFGLGISWERQIRAQAQAGGGQPINLHKAYMAVSVTLGVLLGAPLLGSFYEPNLQKQRYCKDHTPIHLDLLETLDVASTNPQSERRWPWYQIPQRDLEMILDDYIGREPTLCQPLRPNAADPAT